MELKFYSQLSTVSRRAMERVTTKWGHPYKYKPRGNLLKRLSKQSGMSIEEVYIQLLKERQYLLGQISD